jgi:hypothetical protein
MTQTMFAHMNKEKSINKCPQKKERKKKKSYKSQERGKLVENFQQGGQGAI